MTTRKHPHEEEGEPATGSLEGKVAEMESAAAETKDKYLRLAADFENYKKRSRQEQMETIQHASADLISRLLPIEAVGARFDPKLHEAVGHEESAEQPEDTVTSELRRGYRIRDRVVRPALVKLARRPALPDDDEPN